ncbi:MAG: bifunctional DNA primase/polymerase [Proteiniphilum sp.]
MILCIYEQYGFKFFPCKADKSPDTRGDWRAEENQITLEQAEALQATGRMIGAWIPEDVIVLDLDLHEGQPDGVVSFRDIKAQYGITFDLMDETLVVQTGGNGLHIFFTLQSGQEFRQGGKAPGIDLKTHKGYVIAAGSPGYRALTEYDPCPLPEGLALWLEACETRKEERSAERVQGCDGGAGGEGNLLPVKTLRGILSKVRAENFAANDRWLEFVTSIIATCGDSPDVRRAIEEWSRSDPAYSSDRSVDKRIASFTPEGGITVGTFIHILREEGVSQYLVNQVVKFDSVSSLLTDAEAHETRLPFADPDYEELSNSPEAQEFFNIQGNTAAASLLFRALRDIIIYVEGEKRNYYFNGSRWDRAADMFSIAYTVLFRTIKVLFAKIESSKENNDRLMKVIQCVNDRQWKKASIEEFNMRAGIFNEFIDWDSPAIKETLTTIDGVIDFRSGKAMERSGLQAEWRKSHVPFTTAEIMQAGEPVKFIEFMHEIFPDDATRETAFYSIALCVSGNAGKRHFQLWEGAGSNGKSTLIEILTEVLGKGKAITYKPELLLANKFDTGMGATPELAAFQGAYAAFGVEVEQNKKFSLGRIKQLTGGDSISARALYQNQISFQATWQLILAVNDLPSFNGDDQAFISRLLVLPFEMRFWKTESDRNEYLDEGIPEARLKKAMERERLQADITQERPAIIRYLIELYIRLQAELDGVVPESLLCKRKKTEYVKDNDDMGLFLSDLCEVSRPNENRNYFTPSEEIADAYREFVGNKKLSTSFITRLIKKYNEHIESGIRKLKVWDEESRSEKMKSVRGLENIILKDNAVAVTRSEDTRGDDEDTMDIPF